jgi:hypothetical protein
MTMIFADLGPPAAEQHRSKKQPHYAAISMDDLQLKSNA